MAKTENKPYFDIKAKAKKVAAQYLIDRARRYRNK